MKAGGQSEAAAVLTEEVLLPAGSHKGLRLIRDDGWGETLSTERQTGSQPTAAHTHTHTHVQDNV